MRALWLILLPALLLTGVVQAQNEPAIVAGDFLTHWALRDYESMYALLSARSRDLTSGERFVDQYRQVDQTLGAEALEYRVSETKLQGHSAAIRYDLSLLGTVYGDIIDRDRTMRLLREAGSWRVAWSALDIFEGLGNGGILRSTGRRAPRANIYDRNDRGLVTQGDVLYSLYLRLDDIPNEARCLDVLAATLLRQREDLAALFLRYNRDTIFYAGEADEAAFGANSEGLRRFCAVRAQERLSRRYWYGAAVSHVTGSIGQISVDELALRQAQGYQAGDLVGLNGIEAAFEAQLAGQPTRTLQLVEPGGIVLRELGTSEGSAPLPVALTLDRELQLVASRALAEAFNYAGGNWGARGISPGGAAVVLDATNGAILALASYPGFEPDIFNPDTLCCGFLSAGARIGQLVSDARRPMRNRAVQEQYAPGSIYKIVTAAAFAEAGFMAPGETFNCTLEWDGAPFGDSAGFVRVDWRHTAGYEATGPVTTAEALTSSCDPFFYEAGARLYNERNPSALVELSRAFGLGDAVGLGIFGAEAEGSLPVPGSPAAAINDAIGQGDVQVSPLQMAQLMTAVTSRGSLYPAWLVRQIGGMDGAPLLESYDPPAPRELDLAESTWDILHDGLCAVTRNTRIGTAEEVFRSATYHACGKTGTAQTAGRPPHAWFTAWAPAQEPEIIVVVAVEHSREGSEVAAPIVRRIMDDYFQGLRAPWPEWWAEEPYVPVEIPVGGTGG